MQLPYHKSELYLWPIPRLSLKNAFRAKKVTVFEIENWFHELYPLAFPVLMPSARSSIHIILDYLNTTRASIVCTPPFGSHCILNAVSFIGTPSPIPHDKASATLVSHQWGFTKKINLKSVTIEDSVDSLIIGSSNLFPNDGRFEIISLPKLYGSLVGGIILCQSEKDARLLRLRRDTHSQGSFFHSGMRVMGFLSETAHKYWACLEPLNRHLPEIFLRDIWFKLQNHKSIIDDRRLKIKLIKSYQMQLIENFSDNRLVNIFPIKTKSIPSQIAVADNARHFIRSLDPLKTVEVFPVPLHKDITVNELEKTLDSYVSLSNSSR